MHRKQPTIITIRFLVCICNNERLNEIMSEDTYLQKYYQVSHMMSRLPTDCVPILILLITFGGPFHFTPVFIYSTASKRIVIAAIGHHITRNAMQHLHHHHLSGIIRNVPRICGRFVLSVLNKILPKGWTWPNSHTRGPVHFTCKCICYRLLK